MISMPAAPANLDLLCQGIDRAIALAKEGDWGTLVDEGDRLATLFDAAVKADRAVGGNTEASERERQLRLVLDKITQLSDLVSPHHQGLKELLTTQANSQKLSQAYGP